MLNLVDNFLNKITMYRLTLYYLIFLVGSAFVLGMFNLLPFTVFRLAFSVVFLLVFAWIVNKIFSIVFEAPTNFESVYITALILSLVLTPTKGFSDLQFFAWAAVGAVSAKFILAINRKHIFNPAAFGMVAASIATGSAPSWWVGTAYMAPFVLIGGLLIVRKVRKSDMVLGFLGTALAIIIGTSLARGSGLFLTLQRTFLDSPLLFFTFVMLTEPYTTPVKRTWQVVYGVIVGFLFVPQIHFGPLYTTPEVALLAGNIFSYVVSPTKRILLTLKEKVQIAPDMFDFVFLADKSLPYTAGQYLEWTVPHKMVDSRGTRRYFTLASSPTEQEFRMGVKFYPSASSFKRTLFSLGEGAQIFAGQLAGEFTMPKDVNQKLVFIAGGIGITPYRSMVKYLLDCGEKRPITLIYSNKKIQDIVYEDIFGRARDQLGLKVVYTLTDPGVPGDWSGKAGFIDSKMIMEEVPDWKSALFYVSGPHSMVNAFEKTLKQMGVGAGQIKIDFFPGFV